MEEEEEEEKKKEEDKEEEGQRKRREGGKKRRKGGGCRASTCSTWLPAGGSRCHQTREAAVYRQVQQLLQDI